MSHSGESLVKPKTLIVLLALLAVGTAFAEENADADGFVTIDAGVCLFNLKGYELSKPTEEAIVNGLSKTVNICRDTFGFALPEDYKLKLIIFGNKSEFTRHQKEKYGKVISGRWFYVPGEITTFMEPVARDGKNADKIIGTLFHRIGYFMLAQQMSWRPKWLHNGIALYFKGLDTTGENEQIILNKDRLEWCRDRIRYGFPIKLEEYLRLSNDGWRNSRKETPTLLILLGTHWCTL